MHKFVPFIALALAGCAAAIQVGTPSPDPDPTIIGAGTGITPTSQIVIYRASEAGLVSGLVTTPALLLDERTVGTCRFGQPLRLRVPAGNYTVSAFTAGGEENQWVVLEDGATVYLRCGVSAAPSLSPLPRLTRVDAATARRESGL